MWKRHYDRHSNDEAVGQRGRKLRKEVADNFDEHGKVGHSCLYYQQQIIILQCQICNGVCKEARSKQDILTSTIRGKNDNVQNVPNL